MKKFTIAMLLVLGIVIKSFAQCPNPNVVPQFANENNATVYDTSHTYIFENSSTGTGGPTCSWSLNGSFYENTTGTQGNYIWIQFPHIGTNTICMTLTDEGCQYPPVCRTFNVVASTCPTITPSSGIFLESNGAYQFLDESSGEVGNSTANWYVGGTLVGTGTQFFYNFPSSGTYNVCLYVTEPGGCTSSSYCQEVTVSNCPNIVTSFTSSNAGNVYDTGVVYTFTDASTGEDGNQTYSWNVGGTVYSTTNQLAGRFVAAGNYTICLTVTDGTCTYTESCQTITVVAPSTSCPPVVPAFSASNGGSGQYLFDDISTGEDGNETVEWYINGNPSGSGSLLFHTFTTAGTYTVCEYITEPGGCSYTQSCQTITVSTGGCPSIVTSFTSSNAGNVYDTGVVYTFTDASTGEDGNQTYSWNVGGTVYSTTNQLAGRFVAAGNYTICLTITDGTCTYTQYCQTITVVAPSGSCPTVIADYQTLPVGNNTYDFVDESSGEDGNQTEAWYIGSQLIGTGNPFGYNFPSTGTYDVCLYVTEPNGCTYPAYCNNITVSSGCPNVTVSTTSTNSGDTYTFTGATTGTDGNQTYQWTIEGTNVGTGSSLTYIFTAPGTYNVCLAVFDQGCEFDAQCRTVTIGTGCPTITPNYTYTYTGDTYTFTDASTGETGSQLVAWTINGGSPVLNTPYTYTFPAAGSYNVCIELAILSGSNCYYGPVCKTITVGSSCPSVNVAYTDVNTGGNTYQFSDASTGENGSQNYAWTINGNTVSNSSSFNYTFSSSGTYTVCLYVTEPGGCTYTPYCKTITIGGCTGVTASYSYANNGGSSYTFTNNSTGTNGSQTYQWTINNSNAGTGSTLNYTFSSAGTYTVCLTISESGCTFAPYCQTIIITSCPVVNVAYTYVNNGGTSYTFTDASTGENGNQSYVWTVNGTAVGGGNALNYTFSSAGSYIVCLSVTEPGGCTYQDYCRTLTISSCPNVVVNFTDINNGGTSYTFTDASTGENGSQTRSWSVNGNALGSGNTFNYTFPSSGVYNVCLNITEPGGCTYASYCKTISIGGCPGVVAAYTYVNNGGSSYTFTNASTGTNGTQTYQWTVNNANVGTGSTLNYTFTSSGTYDVCLNVAESGCTFAPYCQNFTITTCPNVNVSFNNQSTGGGAYTFTDASTGENGSQTATWSVNGTTVGTGATFNYTFPSAGSYNVCLDVTEPGGCNYSQSCRSITVVGCPSVVANYTYVDNGNNSYTFTDASTGENGSQTYNWTVAGTTAGTGSTLNYTFANAGTYTVCLNVAEPGCTYTPHCASVTINNGASVIITTTAATNVTTVSARLNGSVTTTGTQVTSLAFNWGTTGNYGNTVVATPSSANSNLSFDANIGNLTPNTTYYFQATGSVSGTTIYGGQQQFTTDATGVPVITSNFDISIYPNPAMQQFTINTHSNETYALNLYNMIGQRALTQLVTQPVSTVDISTLANGIYNVVIEKDNTVKTYRLVVLNK